MCRSIAAGGRRCKRVSRRHVRNVSASPIGSSAPQRKSAAVLSQQADSTGATPEPMDLGTGRYADIKGDERTAAILQDLHSAVEQIAQSGRIEQWLDAMATDGLRRWSANNRLLALLQLQERAQQRPELLDDVHMMSFRQWDKEHGRKVIKGERAIWILAPRTRRIEEEDAHGDKTSRTIVTGFTAVPVFNITQTQGPELPRSPIRPGTGEVPPGVLTGLRDRVAAAGYTYREEELPDAHPELGTGTLGYTDPAAKVIVVDPRLSPHQKASTIAHELGHVHVGHVDAAPGEYRQHRGQMETEAEAAAYITCRKLGIDRDSSEAFSPAYIAGWMAQKGADFQTALGRAVKAADTILDGDWPGNDDKKGAL